MVAFANRKPAVCLWQGGGAFKDLFQFLALRLLLAPDQALDCEKAHAKWNGLCHGKRNLRLPSMNAPLRLMSYLESHASQFPQHETLGPHLEREAMAHRQVVAQVEADEEVAPGYRHQATQNLKT